MISLREVERRCMAGDHRPCAPSDCAVAARWHEPVRRAGMNAAQGEGVAYAVVSTIENRVDVVGTAGTLDDAEALRTRALERARIPFGPEGYGLVCVVPVVRETDGTLL